jgi:phosphoglycolate phosphatase-like HAD superfamily hydrolase
VDMETARAVGCYALGATWGYRPEEELRVAGADQLCATPEAASRAISAWLTQFYTGGE